MGRKRERKQAGSGRRLKIDLSADDPSPSHQEPPSTHEDDNGARNSDGHLSPKTSGPSTKENALALLGQYDDDEDAHEQRNHGATLEDGQIDAQVKDFIAGLETSGLLDGSTTDEVQLQKPTTDGTGVDAGSTKADGEAKEPQEPPKKVKPAKKVSKVTFTSVPSVEAIGSWKPIYDEESRGYYYWNVETGATTWTKPTETYELPVVQVEQTGYGVSYEGTTETGYSEDVYANGATAYTDSSSLIQLGESVAHGLRLLAGDTLSRVSPRARLYLEAEMRLSDCKLMAAQGNTESAFWVHTETQIRRLQALLAAEEAASNPDDRTPEVDRTPKQPEEDADMEIDMDVDDEPAGESVPSSSPGQLPANRDALGQTEVNSGSPRAPAEPETATRRADKNADGNGRVSPTSVSAKVAEAAAAAKNAGKLLRSKKRSANPSGSASLKSNKKVSSLVNKWIAAKEELHEQSDNDEDGDPKAMEKKRQREIEDWRREQIASGRALENANFQPLGTVDWKERKRSKVQSKKIPDLESMSMGLKPGWKAYWDDVSEDVYYANVAKSETTWDRPSA